MESNFKRLVIVSIVGLCTGVTACDSNERTFGQDANALENTVVIEKSVIHTSNPERYQPSYNLRGKLVPIEQVVVRSPYAGTSLKVLVNAGDWVEQGQAIAELQVTRSQINNQLDEGYIEVANINKTVAPKNIKDNQRIRSEDDERMAEFIEDDAEQIGEPVLVYDSVQPEYNDNNALNEEADITSKADDTKASISANTDTETVASVKQDAHPESAISNPLDTKTTTPQARVATASSEVAMSDIVTIIFKAPIAGEVIEPQISARAGSKASADDKSNIDNPSTALNKTDIQADQPLLTIANTRQLQLVGKLPIETQSQLSVGQAVNFKIFDVHNAFTGQISHVIPNKKEGYLTVRAPVISNAENKAVLDYGMLAVMVIEYGDKELAVRLPRQAIKDADLDELTIKYPRPVSPIHGFVWVVKQDETLASTPVEVVQYFPETDQFLVHGISNDSLVSSADLPKSADGKRVVIR